MQTIIEINSTNNQITAPVTVSADTPAVPAVGDDVSLPTPFARPTPGATQQLTVRNRIFRYTVDSTGAPHLYVLLVTNSIIT